MAAVTYESESTAAGERTVQRAFVHWIVYAPAFLFAVAAYFTANFWPALLFFIALSAISTVVAAVQAFTTEIVITNKRAFCKKGLILRRTEEIAMRNIEGVYVNQSILGRVLNYGEIVIRGTGAGTISLPAVSSPLELRKALQPT